MLYLSILNDPIQFPWTALVLEPVGVCEIFTFCSFIIKSLFHNSFFVIQLNHAKKENHFRVVYFWFVYLLLQTGWSSVGNRVNPLILTSFSGKSGQIISDYLKELWWCAVINLSNGSANTCLSFQVNATSNLSSHGYLNSNIRWSRWITRNGWHVSCLDSRWKGSARFARLFNQYFLMTSLECFEHV